MKIRAQGSHHPTNTQEGQKLLNTDFAFDVTFAETLRGKKLAFTLLLAIYSQEPTVQKYATDCNKYTLLIFIILKATLRNNGLL